MTSQSDIVNDTRSQTAAKRPVTRSQEASSSPTAQFPDDITSHQASLQTQPSVPAQSPPVQVRVLTPSAQPKTRLPTPDSFKRYALGRTTPSDFHPCSTVDCSMESPCIPFSKMKEDKLRYHFYRKISSREFEVGAIINGPMFVMKMDLQGALILSPLGDISGKSRFGIVVEKHHDYMLVVSLESNNQSGPLYKSPEQLSECFGVVANGKLFQCKKREHNGEKNRELVAVKPGLGILELPENFSYAPIYGANGNPCSTATVCFDTRVSHCGELPPLLTNKVIAWRCMMTMKKSIDWLPVAMIEPIFDSAKQMLDQKKNELANRRHSVEQPGSKRRGEELEAGGRNGHRAETGRPVERFVSLYRDRKMQTGYYARPLQSASNATLGMSLDHLDSKRPRNPTSGYMNVESRHSRGTDAMSLVYDDGHSRPKAERPPLPGNYAQVPVSNSGRTYQSDEDLSHIDNGRLRPPENRYCNVNQGGNGYHRDSRDKDSEGFDRPQGEREDDVDRSAVYGRR